MPNCFQLTRNGDKEAMSLLQIDDSICKHMGVEADPIWWCCNWYEVIGLLLSCGKSFDEIIENDFSDEIKKIAEYLRDNFVSYAWYER